MNTCLWKVTFGDGSALIVESETLDGARVRACLLAWMVCDYWPTVLAVTKGIC